MDLEKEMEEKRIGSIGFYTKSIGIPTAIEIAEQYAEDMCKKQREICAKESLTMSSSTDANILNAPLATESK